MTKPAIMSTGRLEAFSDGVLAVAITLLVLDLHADAQAPDGLASQLRHEWPSFAAYILSFFIIGVIWVNHHALFGLADRVDRPVLYFNLLLLLWVSTIPFTTSTLASFLRSGGTDSRLAVLLYGLSMEGMAISFTLILRRLISAGLLRQPVERSVGRAAVRRFGLGAVVYPAIVLVGLISAPAMLALYAGLTIFYIFEQTPVLPAP
ncbi:MAG: TMEM175 family protein [Jatrophihabitantaceae bacterium]